MFPKGLVHSLSMWFFTPGSSKIEVFQITSQFFSLYSSKIEDFETYVFNIVIT